MVRQTWAPARGDKCAKSAMTAEVCFNLVGHSDEVASTSSVCVSALLDGNDLDDPNVNLGDFHHSERLEQTSSARRALFV